MKLSIRQGVFETNSSSVHAVVYMYDEDYNKWKNEGKYFWISQKLEQYDEVEIRNPRLFNEDEAIDLVLRYNDELGYYFKDTESEDDRNKLLELVGKGLYRPFLEVGLIPYLSMDDRYDAGMLCATDDELIDGNHELKLLFMV